MELLKITDWDFRWQGYYQCKAPLRLPAGTVIETVWTFDNSADNPAQPSHPPKRVRFGEETTDEMGAIVLDYVLAPAEPAANVAAAARLARDLMHRHDTNGDRVLTRDELLKADPSKQKEIDHALGTYDANKDGRLDAAELEKACIALLAARP